MATKFVLPNPGDINGQVAQGASLIKALGMRDAPSLSSAGISLAHGSGPSVVGATLSGAVTGVGVGLGVASGAAAIGTAAASAGAFAGAMSGLAACGPYGAVAAGIITFVATLFNAFSNNYEGVRFVFPPEAAGNGPSTVITQRIALWPSGSGATTDAYGKPVGYALAEYLSFVFPPSTTKRPDLALHLMQEVAKEVLAEGIIAQNSIGSGDIASIELSDNPLTICGVVQRGNLASRTATVNPSVSPQVFMSPAAWGSGQGCQPVASMLLWHWLDWHTINLNNSTGSAGPQQYPGNLYAYDIATGTGKLSHSYLLKNLGNTIPLSSKLSTKACITRALQRAPDPLFFDADLYGCVPGGGSSNPPGGYTMYYNVDLANAMATVCMMLEAGICTRGIASELMMQANILAMGNALNQGPGNPKNVSPAFRALLDDYLALAIAEDRDPKATMASVIGSYPPGFAGRSPSPNPVPLKPGESTVQHFVNLYLAGHS